MQDTSCKQQTKQKYKPSHQQTGLPPHSALPIRGKTNENSAQISTYTKLTQTAGPNLGQKPKGRKNVTLESWEKEIENRISQKKKKRKGREILHK